MQRFITLARALVLAGAAAADELPLVAVLATLGYAARVTVVDDARGEVGP
jgi:hypothetical protein